jgi:hypothetical protein
MRKTGVANLPLHHGKTPVWLFRRMVKLSGLIGEAIIKEHGPDAFVQRISDPFFFQSLGCVIGFDWHSSGLTTTTLGALKESLNKKDIGVRIAGGKGQASRKTPEEVSLSSQKYNFSMDKERKLLYASKMAAKVDNSVVQDGYQLYHHCFFLTEKGDWAVVQQGMSETTRYARRYHWLSNTFERFVEEPHSAICSPTKEQHVLDLTSRQNQEAQKNSLELLQQDANYVRKHIAEKKLKLSFQSTLHEFSQHFQEFSMSANHFIVDMHGRSMETLQEARQLNIKTYEELVALKGVGAKTLRSLALLSEIIYGTPLQWKDPVKYTFAHGGKDGIPYPVDRKTYDSSIDIVKNALRDSRMGNDDKMKAMRRLAALS